MRVGRISQRQFPSYSFCAACGTTWNLVEHHRVMFSEHSGCFALCEECWAEKTPAERWTYYRDLLDEWTRDGHPPPAGSYEAMKKAIIG